MHDAGPDALWESFASGSGLYSGVRPASRGARGTAAATSLLLARASTPEQAAFIGNQAGGRVFLFLATDDLVRDHAAMVEKGVVFVREPKVEPYGTVAVFRDLYGNLWDLVQYADRH